MTIKEIKEKGQVEVKHDDFYELPINLNSLFKKKSESI